MRFFSICSNNYLANAIALGRQLERFHPDSEFTIFLADKPLGYDPALVPFPLVPMQDLGLVDERGMIVRYNISELNTAIKPFCFSYLFSDSDEPVVYMDPDTYPVSPLHEVSDALGAGHDAVLTPHILRPVEHGGFPTENFLRLGIYNLGFLALAATPTTENFLTWWAEKLEKDCVIDIPRGIFVDQKWADFVPSFMENCKVLRHAGYNVAYWNLQNRRIARDGDGTLTSNGEALRFVHFSGLPDDPACEHISKRHTAFTKSNVPVLGEVLEEYRQATRDAGDQLFSTVEFSYFLSPNGTNLHAPELETKSDRVLRQPGSYMVTRLLRSFDDYQDYQRRNRTEIESRRRAELSLLEGQSEILSFPGYDFIAGQHTTFVSSYLYAYDRTPSGDLIPNWREHIATPGGYCNRIRGFVHVFFQEFQPPLDSHIYLTEQATDLYRWFGDRFPNVTGSEHLGASHPAGSTVDGLRNENVENLTLESNQFDFILSLDVFEHVVDYKSALSEMLRCLKPGGYFVFAIPTNGMDRYENCTRAYVDATGETIHLMEPEYHGNPVDDDGALCYRYYGWQLLDELTQTGFQNPVAIEYWSDAFGYLGPDQMLFVAQKPYATSLGRSLDAGAPLGGS